MNNKSIWTITAISLVSGLAGCSDPPLQTSDGKAGYVAEIFAVGHLPPSTSPCLAALPKEQLLTGQFIRVDVAHLRSRRSETALVPPGIKLAVHDRVELSPSTCKDGKIPTVQQVLSSQTSPRKSD